MHSVILTHTEVVYRYLLVSVISLYLYNFVLTISHYYHCISDQSYMDKTVVQ